MSNQVLNAYFSACAIRWVMRFVDLPDNTFYDREKVGANTDSRGTVSLDTIKEWISSEEGVDQNVGVWVRSMSGQAASSNSVATMNWSVSLLLVSTVSAVVVPTWLYSLKKEEEKPPGYSGPGGATAGAGT